MAVLFAVLATMFEWIEFSLFLFFPDIINKVFLGESSESILVAFMAWATAYISRGFGAFFVIPKLKNFADSKKAILFTGSLVVVPAIFIAMLPSYQSIGILSCYIFLVLRFVQGLGIGVDFPVSIYYIFDKYDSLKKTTMVFSCGTIGLFSSFTTVYFAKKHGFIEYFYIENNWRILFVIIALFGVISFIIRFFIKKENYNNFLQNNKYIFRIDRKKFLLSFFISYSYGSVFYLFFTYIPFFYKDNFDKIFTSIFLFISFLITFSIILVGKNKHAMKILSFGYIFSIIICLSLIMFHISVLYQSFLMSLIIAIYASSFVYCMLKNTTFYTFATSYNFGQGIAALLTPIVCKELSQLGISVYLYIIIFTIFGLISLENIKDNDVSKKYLNS